MPKPLTSIHHGPESIWGKKIEIEPSTRILLNASSGKGKSTFTSTVFGLRNDYSGDLYFDDQNVRIFTHSKWSDFRQRRISAVFQDLQLFPKLTVKENLQLKNEITNTYRENELRELLEYLGIGTKWEQNCGLLSMGQQQRVAIIRALSQPYEWLLLDEPFSSLDLNLKEEVRDDTLHLLQKSNISVLVVTHDPFEAMFISNKIYIMNKEGKIVQSGSPKDLYNLPNSSYVANFFGETNKFTGVVKNKIVKTAVGDFLTDKSMESENVSVYIRPEAVKLSREQTPVNGIKGTVMASKLMGSYSFVHLSVLSKDNEIVHVHSHMPPNFLPNQSSAVGIEIDREQTFIFSNS